MKEKQFTKRGFENVRNGRGPSGFKNTWKSGDFPLGARSKAKALEVFPVVPVSASKLREMLSFFLVLTGFDDLVSGVPIELLKK